MSGTINQQDGNYKDNNSEINIRIVSWDQVQEFIFIYNDNNIDGTYLNRGRLHLNKKEYSKFSLNLFESMKSVWLDVMHATIFLSPTFYVKR